MKKYVFLLLALLGCSVFIFSRSAKAVDQTPSAHEINWLGLEEAAELAKKNPKPMLIDIYTDWCKWCRVMDETTYQDPEVIKYINTEFYAVKLDAEQKGAITFQGKKYDYVPTGRKGIQEVVVALLGNRPSYPSTVLLDENLQQREVLKGYKKPDQLLSNLSNYVGKGMVSK